jgi:2-ketocyclohexanecarboxyl-CoA hydrolase
VAEYKDIIYEIKDYVARITINRPKSLNAFTGDTVKEIEDAIADATTNPDVGVLVITGTGERAFCVGGDVNWEAGGGLDGLDFNIDRQIIDCPKPVIARVNGYSIGGGNHVAYFCDFTIAAEHAIFGQNGPRVGSPAAGHLVSYLANVLGHKRAREMWMLCRKYTAKEMLDWGLVNAVVPYDKLDEEVDKWCRELLSLSPTCLKVLKQTFRDNVDDVMASDQKDVLLRVAPNYFETGEQPEGARAFLEKRAPDFSPWR